MSCPICDDTRWRPVDSHATDGVRRVVRCECWQGEHTRRLFDEARIPARYRRCDFDNFQVYPNEKLTNAVSAVRRFADAFPNSPKGLCLIGPHGIGKTHLAVAVLRELAEVKWPATSLELPGDRRVDTAAHGGDCTQRTVGFTV